jgi:RNase adaptor protein for sRNA GlmZ degradation
LTLVIVGANEPQLDEAVGVFIDSGFQLARWLSAWDQADAVLPLRGDAVSLLKDADAQSIRYVLVHVGAADGRAGGSHERAHHRVDVAQLRENPYWVEELRPLDGRDPRVRDYVVRQPAAQELLDNLEKTLRAAIPHYRERGRSHLMVAFGCTGGRHRSVAMANEMAARLESLDGTDVEFTSRDT